MNKKFLLSTCLFLLITCSFTLCFAQELSTDMEDLGEKTKNSITTMTDDMKNNTENLVTDAKSSMDNMVQDTKNGMENTDTMIYEEPVDSNYTATRTSTEATLLGMNSTAWTWLIVGIAAITIFALIWYYVMQSRIDNYNNKD